MSYHGQKVLAIIQARMQSSRLPGKVLHSIGGQSMLARVVRRAQLAETVDRVMVATTDATVDNLIEEACGLLQVDCYRGSQPDVLDRYYQAASMQKPNWIIRLTADCPLLDPALIDRTVQAAWAGNEAAQYDFTANRLPPPWGRTYPIGLDVEVFSYPALERAWRETTEKPQREHVTPYFYETAELDDMLPVPDWGRSWHLPERGFNILLVDHPTDYGEIRWTVDTPQDMELVRELVRRLPQDGDFSWLDILEIYQADPALARVNEMIIHKTHKDVDERS